MFEYTVLEPFSIPTASGLRDMQRGEHITDSELFEILERPAYARNVSRHYVTSEEQAARQKAEEEAAEAARKAAEGENGGSASSDAKADEKLSNGKRSAAQVPTAPAPDASDTK